jgi:D-alanyl-D-alanine carboxypeptidase/D-alanyl-D-alanine-endopeptidase (penicillin-binding protein 4)
LSAVHRRTLVAIALALCASALTVPAAVTAGATSPAATTAPGLAARLGTALRGAGLAPGRTAAIAVDLRTGEMLFAHNATRPFVPASNEKLPVSWAVLSRLGPATTIPTEIVGDGAREGTTWHGDLVLKGYGDPTLSAADVDGLARTVAARGIRTLDGRVVGDESFFDARRDAAGWKRGFLGIESPPLSALVVDRALGWPTAPPAVLAARALRAALQRHGVVVRRPVTTGVAPVEGRRLARTESAPLAELVQAMNTDSDNFVAEMLLKQLGAADGHSGSTARGAQAVIAELRAAGVPTTGVRLVDGSGLSGLDRVTAAMLVGVFRAALADPEVRAPFMRSLAVAGRSGTLAQRYGLPAGGVRGKTGTTNLACTLSGLLRGTIAFAVLQNGDPVASWAARGAQDRFVTALAQGTAST